jgi:hypothetical protein
LVQILSDASKVLQTLCSQVLKRDCSQDFRTVCEHYKYGKLLPVKSLKDSVQKLLKDNGAVQRLAVTAGGAAAGGSSFVLAMLLARDQLRQTLRTANDDVVHQHVVTKATARLPCRCVARGVYIEDIPGTSDPNPAAANITSTAIASVRMVVIVLRTDTIESVADLDHEDFEDKIEFSGEAKQVLEDNFEEKMVQDPDR